MKAVGPEEYWHWWLSSNPCPPNEKAPTPGINSWWMPRAARYCANKNIPAERACDLIRGAMTRPEKVSYEVSRTVERIYDEVLPRSSVPTVSKVDLYSPAKLQQLASHVPFEVDAEWLTQRSPCPLDLTPTQYLDKVFEPWEYVFVCTSVDSSGPELFHLAGNKKTWANIDKLVQHNQHGAWFVVNSFQQDSRRTDANLAYFRYCLLESDVAPADLWLKMLVLLHMPLVSIVESGNRSVHALVRIGCSTKAEFDRERVKLIEQLCPFGCDPASLTASRLSRLPGVTRGDNGRVQRLLWLSPNAKAEPIYDASPVEV